MILIIVEGFYGAHVMNGLFHAQQVYNEPIDEMRLDIRRQLFARHNIRNKYELSVLFQ